MEQDDPTPGIQRVKNTARGSLVLAWDRQVEKGESKYGTPLMTFNGRDPYRDALEEIVDAVQYITQIRMEAKAVEDAFVQLFDRSRLTVMFEDEEREEIDYVYNKIRSRQLQNIRTGETTV